MSTSIFTFDHGQKKLNKAIGVSSEYLDELQDIVKKIVCKPNSNNDEEEGGCSPSELVEASLIEFSYSQLVLLSSFYLRDKMEQLQSFKLMKALHSDDDDSDDSGIPQELKDIINKIKSEIKRRGLDPEQED